MFSQWASSTTTATRLETYGGDKSMSLYVPGLIIFSGEMNNSCTWVFPSDDSLLYCGIVARISPTNSQISNPLAVYLRCRSNMSEIRGLIQMTILPVIPFNLSNACGSAANITDLPVVRETNVSFPLRIESIALNCSGFNAISFCTFYNSFSPCFHPDKFLGRVVVFSTLLQLHNCFFLLDLDLIIVTTLSTTNLQLAIASDGAIIWWGTIPDHFLLATQWGFI